METSWDEERELQTRVVEGLFGGESDAGGLRSDRDALAVRRAALLERLRELGTESARGEIASQVDLERRRLREIEDGEIAVLLEDGDAGGAVDASAPSRAFYAATLAAGERLEWLRSLVEALDGEVSADPERAVEGELLWIESRTRELRSAGRELAGAGEVLAATRTARLALQRKGVEAWLERGGFDASPPAAATSAAGGGGEATGAREHASTRSTAAALQSSWARVLEYHDIIADLAITDYRDAEQVRALRESRLRSLHACRRVLEEADREERRESALVAAAGATESHVSNLLSEGDLREPRERSLQHRAAAAAADDFFELAGAGDAGDRWFRRGSPRRRRFLAEQRNLRWVRRYAVRSAQSAELEARTEQTLGRTWLRRLENLVFLLIVALVAVVVIEWRMEAAGTLTPGRALAFQIADLCLCLPLLADFFFRWSCTRWGVWFLRRHFVFDLLPALPFGFLFGPLWFGNYYLETWASEFFAGGMAVSAARYAHLLLVFRVFRLVRLVRGLRVAVTALRLFRVLVFLVRGTDRAVQRFRGFLDRNILIFEATTEDEKEDALLRALSLQDARRTRMTRELYREARWEERAELLSAHLRFLEQRIRTLSPARRERRRRRDGRRLRLESLIARLTTCDRLDVENALGQRQIERLARYLRWSDLPLIRHLPLIRRWVPASRLPDPAEAVAEASREFGKVLENVLAVFFVGGDLSGITTAPQVLDRVATAMIVSTQRPAIRLIVLGGFTLLLSVFFEQGNIFDRILKTLGVPFFILGSICLVVNVTGRWFKRISGEALDIYLRASEAHFFHLLEEVKARRLRQDLAELRERVIVPECELRSLSPEEIRIADEFLEARVATPGGGAPVDGDAGAQNPIFADFLFREMEQVALLYRDYLDGALLERASDKTSIQLLGNLAIRDIRGTMLGMGKREFRKLEKLALEKDRFLGFGPYLWFRFISESLLIETAKLLMEYNACCIPRDRIATAPEDVRRRFERFLESRRGEIDPVARRLRRSPIDVDRASMVTTEFNALHFLTADGDRDRRIRQIFGDEVARAMVADRRATVRDVFGTWPYHLLPRSVRRVNPYRLYVRHLGGARIFLLPGVVVSGCVRMAFRVFRSLVRVVREVLGGATPRSGAFPRAAGFDVAIRKINRMRKPYFMEAMRLRAAVDVEYLGLRIPGLSDTPGAATCWDDLDFVGAIERERQPFEQLRRAAVRDLRALRLFLAERGWRGEGFRECLRIVEIEEACRGREHEVSRAIVSAFITDQHGLRTAIAGPREARELFDRILERPPPSPLVRAWKLFSHGVLARALPSRRRRRRLFERYARIHGRLRAAAPRERRRALGGFLDAPRSMAAACERAVELEENREQYEAAILEALRRVALEHALWSRKLITLRLVQSLTVLDIQAYRDLVWTLGGYAEDRGDASEIPRHDVGREGDPVPAATYSDGMRQK